MNHPRLIVFTDTLQFPDPVRTLAPLLRAAVARRVLVVLRDRQLPLRQRLELGRALREQARLLEQGFGVSQRLDLARTLGAEGLHLPGEGVSALDARRALPGAFLSRAFHSAEALQGEELRALDAVVVSPVQAPRKGRQALGIAGFARELRLLRAHNPALLVYALGGVTASGAAAWCKAGASGVAVIGAGHAADPAPLLGSLGILRRSPGKSGFSP